LSATGKEYLPHNNLALPPKKTRNTILTINQFDRRVNIQEGYFLEHDDVLTETDNKSRRQVIVTAEYEQLQFPLSDLLVNEKLSVYPEIIGTKYFTIFLRQDSLIFQVGEYIGLIPINDRITLDVRPRVPVKNLERILRVTNEVPKTLNLHLREYAIHDTGSPSLIDILARSLMNAISEIEKYGLYKEYIQKTENASFPRGRIMIGATMRQHEARGRGHAVTTTWFEHSTDTAPNKCIKYAIWLLLQRYKSVTPREGQMKIVSDLNRVYALFGRVSLDTSKSFLKDPLVVNPSRMPSLRSYYASILHLAITIIENRGISFSKKGRDIVLPSMIFDFDVVFEKYLRKILEMKFQMLSPNLKVLDGNVGGPNGGKKALFDKSPRQEPAKPDIVVRQEGVVDLLKKNRLLVEAKYKPVDFPVRSDIDQAIGYGVSYRCNYVVLAHPKREGGVSGLRLVGTIGDFNFYQYTFDLANENPEEEEIKFAKEMLLLINKTTISEAASVI
jgi:5-methylcytosine-specific restriction enzyme subunit McrC